MYAKLAREAIDLWGTSERWKEFYHASGVIALSSKEDPQTGYVQKAYEFNKLELGEGVCECREDEGMKELYEEGHSTGSFKGDWGVSLFYNSIIAIQLLIEGWEEPQYKNKSGGWAASRDAVLSTISLARKLGVRFVSGEASSLLYNTSRTDVTGVKLSTGQTFLADLIISAIGSWTPLLLPELGEKCLPTGQTVAVIQLNEEERKRYENVPVSLCMDTGFYCFPPTSAGLMKFGTLPLLYLLSLLLSFIVDGFVECNNSDS